MRAVTMASPADGSVLVCDRPAPSPGTGEVLVRVRAAGLNAADLLQARGAYPAPPGSPPDILGLELAGEVAALGQGARRFAVGDRVMAVVGGGAQAEWAVVHERAAMPVPDPSPGPSPAEALVTGRAPGGLGWAGAGGFPEAFTTAHDALFSQCRLQLGESLLVHAAAGGVGTAAVQLAVAASARVVATVRNPDLRPSVAALGAAVTAPDGFTELGPFDVVLELVGAPNLAADIDCLATGGRIVVIGVGGGHKAEVSLVALMSRRAEIRGSTLRARSLEDKAQAARRMEAHVLPLMAAGRVRPLVHETFSLEEAPRAYESFARGGKLGKVVLVTGSRPT
ncbi:MAG: zinc-binding dehydrogenase [Acidimicrobiales bacterium]